jgi:hypothetical protein
MQQDRKKKQIRKRALTLGVLGIDPVAILLEMLAPLSLSFCICILGISFSTLNYCRLT